MLAQLVISNFAIINHLEINFQPGLNILSGETGAGKSIIINAVNLILGGRASGDLIRTGADEARVEAFFNPPDNPALSELLSGMEIPLDNGELLIKRTLSREGRNKILINGCIATLQMLSRLGSTLISISGQHSNQLLLGPENHLFLLDDFGVLVDERMDLAKVFDQYESLKGSCSQLSRIIKEGREKQELAKFQIQEIDAAQILEQEDKLLDEEKKRLKYAVQIREIISKTYQALYENEASALSDISMCIRDLNHGISMEKRLEPIIKSLESAASEIEAVGLELRDLQDCIEADPVRLEDVEERLQFLNNLKRKYGPSLEDIQKFQKRLSGMMDNLDQKEKELEKIELELKGTEDEILKRAIELSKKRNISAEILNSSVEKELALLDMEGTRFEVRFDEQKTLGSNEQEELLKKITADGIDKIEFMISPNVGEELRALSRIASGGELSRIMLALKSILARKRSVETVVFDEVDAGISGATAEVVGEKLQTLAQYHQILCITHLPQIASKGKYHFLVKKRVKENRTQTDILALTSHERIQEIARLLGGKVISKQAMAHAKDMLSQT